MSDLAAHLTRRAEASANEGDAGLAELFRFYARLAEGSTVATVVAQLLDQRRNAPDPSERERTQTVFGWVAHLLHGDPRWADLQGS